MSVRNASLVQYGLLCKKQKATLSEVCISWWIFWSDGELQILPHCGILRSCSVGVDRNLWHYHNQCQKVGETVGPFYTCLHIQKHAESANPWVCFAYKSIFLPMKLHTTTELKQFTSKWQVTSHVTINIILLNLLAAFDMLILLLVSWDFNALNKCKLNSKVIPYLQSIDFMSKTFCASEILRRT